MQYKINQSIRIRYLELNKTTGITDLKLIVQPPSGEELPPISMTEVDGQGMYEASFIPDATGWWWARVKSVTYPANVYSKSYFVGTDYTIYPPKEDGNLNNINTKLGEVQTSPTTNTVLARLKNIYDRLVDGITATIDKVKIWDGTYSAEVDSLGYLVAIAQQHHKIHDGIYFHIDDYNIINSGNNRDCLIITGSKKVHITFGLTNRFKSLISIYEDTVVSANGTSNTVKNMNRNSSNVALSACYTTPTITSIGTQIFNHFLESGTVGMVRSEEEFILKPNSKYLIRISSFDNNNNSSLIISFYED